MMSPSTPNASSVCATAGFNRTNPTRTGCFSATHRRSSDPDQWTDRRPGQSHCSADPIGRRGPERFFRKGNLVAREMATAQEARRKRQPPRVSSYGTRCELSLDSPVYPGWRSCAATLGFVVEPLRGSQHGINAGLVCNNEACRLPPPFFYRRGGVSSLFAFFLSTSAGR